MIAAKRTTRDSAVFVIPVLAGFCSITTYASLAAYGVDPDFGAIASDNFWGASILAIVFWLALISYVLTLLDSVTYLTEVFPDRVELSDSSSPGKPIVFRREDVARFYIQPGQWWHNPDASYPVICETRSGQKIEIVWHFVDDSNSKGFFAAVRDVWGEEYAPAP
ncbi:MAG: hypothetical protein MUC83_01940 [Pirellula sp.]|nr:hypothetical protein [Pirellula sp.]